MPRRIVLTGPTSGIGAALRDRFLTDGHDVIGISRHASVYQHPQYIGIDQDLCDLQALEAITFPELRKKFPVDTFICNAASPLFGMLEQLSVSQIAKSIQANLMGAILLTHALLPTLRLQSHANIVYIGSETALRPAKRGSIYAAAKSGLRGFALALRHECAGSNVAISQIHPGMVRTPWFDSLDFSPSESANAALLSNDVVDAVMYALNARPGTVVDEIHLSPSVKSIVRKNPKPIS